MSSSIEIFERALEFLKKGKRVALCTVVEKIGSGPAERGTKMFVTEDGELIGTIGGGEDFERGLKEEALRAIREHKSKSLKFAFCGAKEGELETGLWCGGKLTAFIDVLDPKPKLVIVGSGHVALSTYKMADFLGFDITVIDDNRNTLTKERFPNARLVCHEDFEQALGEVKGDEMTYITILHGDPTHDLAALRKFAREKTAYLGILGSKSKSAKLKEILRKEGVPEDVIKKISAPVGLDIGAETPEEIAVSIVAELVGKMRKSSERP
jgi:xanthine dehydrogenase accessory factor